MYNNACKYSDNTQENCLLAFMDKYVYPRLCTEHEFMPDKTFRLSQGISTHAVKGQLAKHSINNPKDSFSFEILANGNPGWFLKPTPEDVYVLAFVRQAKLNSYGYMVSAEDIEELELLFVAKSDLKRHINESIYDDAMYQTAVNMCRQNTRSILISQDMYLYHTESSAKQTVSLMVKKYKLEELASIHLIATKEEIKSIA